ncbi:hypothetical protein Ndes2526B_g01931 [Nannochloris sp. 'desiccata']|nr:hypothetical protein NADE_002681 [Chlorella desiccata (nom. nud.)]
MEFEWIYPEKTSQNAGRALLSRSSARPELLPVRSSSIVSPTAPSAPSSSTSSSSGTDTPQLPMIPSVPVPMITVGKVFAPIPQGRQTIHPEAMEAARHLGLAPMLAAAMGTGLWSSPDEFWDIASLTDPLTASNLMQVSSSGQRRLLFVERGAAERLARGNDELIAVPSSGKKQRKRGAKDGPGEEENGVVELLKALNPLVALEGVCDALQRGISKAAALDSSPLHHQQKHQHNDGHRDDTGRSNSNSSSSSSSSIHVLAEEQTYQIEPRKGKNPNSKSRRKEGFEKKDTSSPPASSPFDSPFTSSLSSSPFEEEGLFGSTAGVNRSTGMAALAHIPVRIALNLLRGASGRFLLLSGRGDGMNTHSHAKKRNKRAGDSSKDQHSEQQPEFYGGADSLDSLQIYFLPKCDLIISSTSGDIKFTPGFLSEAALQKYYYLWASKYVKGVQARRRLTRRAFRQRLRLAAAVVAGAGAGGGGGGSSSGGFGGGGSNDENEEGDDGFGDSPDIYEAIQEISEEMPGFPEAVPTLRPSSSSLIRAGATLATGVLTLLDPLLESYGEVMDSITNFLLERFNQYPYKLSIASRPVGPLLKSFASYNATQAQAAALSASQSSHTAASAATNNSSAATALALAALCMAVGAKLTGDALSNGPIEFLPSLTALRMTLATFSVGAASGGGWASVAAAAAAAAAQSNGDSKETELTSILRSVLPTLEFNGFTEALPMAGDEKSLEAAAVTVGEVLLKETGFLGLTAEVDLEALPEQFLEDMNLPSAGTSAIEKNKGSREVAVDEEGVEEEKVRPTLGRGLVLIGDPGRVLGLHTPRGFSLDGVGIPVGVDDGRRYL